MVRAPKIRTTVEGRTPAAGSDDAGHGAALPGELPATPLVEGAVRIVAALQQAGYEAYLVGGCVRNWLLGLPMEDVDIATSATPETMGPLFGAARSVGAHFGVLLVPEGEHTYEVATFRAEGAYTDHRHPSQVRYGQMSEDFRRRDFTVNAMYYDPIARRLVDPAGGREDLARRTLRTVGEADERFAEDALRLLRAVRFAVRYSLTIEDRTRRAIRAHAATLAEISVERVAEELLKILTGPEPGRAVRLMSDLGLWAVTIPEIEALHGCPQPPEFHPEGDVFIHSALAMDQLRGLNGGPPTPELALGTLLHDIGKPPTLRIAERVGFPEHDRVGAIMAGEICLRLRLSRRMSDQVVDLVAQHMRFMDVHRMKPSTLRRFVTLENFPLHLELHRADCLACHGDLTSYDFCLAERERLAQERPNEPLLPPPLVTGHDLIALGLKPSPRFKILLDATRDEQLEGRLTTRETALAWLKEQAEAPEA